MIHYSAYYGLEKRIHNIYSKRSVNKWIRDSDVRDIGRISYCVVLFRDSSHTCKPLDRKKKKLLVSFIFSRNRHECLSRFLSAGLFIPPKATNQKTPMAPCPSFVKAPGAGVPGAGTPFLGKRLYSLSDTQNQRFFIIFISTRLVD